MRNTPANVGITPTRANGAIYDQWKKYYIYKIPAYVKAQNPGAYSPQLAAIGPYHHGKADLQAMEEHKDRALQRFIGDGSISINKCCDALESKLDELISSYQSLGEEWKGSVQAIKNKFLMVMVKDGVFLYEFMRGYPDSVGWEYDKQDPVFSVSALRRTGPNMIADILMLENQLPLVVLERLIAVEKDQRDDTHHEEVNKLVLKFLSADPPFNSDISQPLGLHVLDLSRKVIAAKFEPILDRQHPRATAIGVKSATILDEVGVKFRESEIQTVVSFVNATLRLPPLIFNITTEPHFLNAIAFECLHPATNNEVRSYIAFLQGLIASPSDVAFLRSKDLIQSEIGDDQAVDGLVKTISKNVLFDPSSDMCRLRDSLNEYYKDNKGTCRLRLVRCGKMWRTLFLDPWKILVAYNAIIILFFTIFQTLYTVMDKEK